MMKGEVTIIHDKPEINKRIAKLVQVGRTAVFMFKKIILNTYIFAENFKINLQNNKRNGSVTFCLINSYRNTR